MSERRYSRYRVLTGPDDDRFCERVSEALDLGYVLHGGPAITTRDGLGYVAQAVVWTSEGPPPPRPETRLTTLDHCVIQVSDWGASNAFYRDVLGAELVDRGGGAWAYRFGGQQLNVHGPGVVATGPDARVPVAPGNSDLCLCGPAPSRKRSIERARHRCGAGTSQTTRRSGSGNQRLLRDPDGSLIEFISYDR